MNGTYYPNPTFPSIEKKVSEENINDKDEIRIIEYNYFEDVLKYNKGKIVKVYVSLPNYEEQKNMVFSGIIEQAGKDYIIISTPSDGKWTIILLKYLNYIEFEEKINDLI